MKKQLSHLALTALFTPRFAVLFGILAFADASRGAVVYDFQTFSHPSLSPTTASEIDNTGRVFGFASSPSRGYITLDLTNFTTFLAPGATLSPVQGANDSGTVVGRADSGPGGRSVGYIRLSDGSFPFTFEPPNPAALARSASSTSASLESCSQPPSVV